MSAMGSSATTRSGQLGANRTHTSAVKGRCRFLHWLSRKERNYASFKACAISAIRSDGCSMPIDSRIVESRMPIFWRMSAGTPEWVMLAGRLASDSVPPRLTASLKIRSAFKNLKAAALPPTMSNANVEPAGALPREQKPGGGGLFVVSKVMDLCHFGVVVQVSANSRAFLSAFSMRMLSVSSDRLIIQQEWGVQLGADGASQRFDVFHEGF